MNDVYWNTILQQEGILDNPLTTTNFERLGTFVSCQLSTSMKKPTDNRPDKVILEPSIRLAVTRRIVKHLAAFIEDPEACTARLEGLAEQIESAVYSQSGDADDYFQNVTVFIDSLFFGSPQLFDTTSTSKTTTVPAPQERSREDVIAVLQSYKQPFQALTSEVENQLRELDGLCRPWTNEEKELPKVLEHMNAVYKLLLSILSTPTCSSEVMTGGITTEVLVSIEKQIDYWLSLRKKFPIPVPPPNSTNKSLNGKISCQQASLQGKIPAKSLAPRPIACALQTTNLNNNTTLNNNNKQPCSQAPTLPSLFYNPLHPPRMSSQRRIPPPISEPPPFGSFKLPPFNPQKSLPPKGSQPLLPSVDGATGAPRLFSSSSPAMTTTTSTSTTSSFVADDEKIYELSCISNLTSLHHNSPHTEEKKKGNGGGSAEASPRASLKRKQGGRGASARGGRGGSARGMSPTSSPFDGDDFMSKSSNEHAFILSKLAEVISQQQQTLAGSNTHNSRRGLKRSLPQHPSRHARCADEEAEDEKEEEEVVAHNRRAKKPRSYQFDMVPHLRNPEKALVA